MDDRDGRRVGQAAIDAVAKATEYVDDPSLLAVSITILVEDGEGSVHVITHCWPQNIGS